MAEKLNLDNKSRLALRGAKAMTAVALFGGLSANAEAKADTPGHAEAAPVKLINPDKLPGHNINVSKEAFKHLKDATVFVFKKYPDGTLTPAGTGVRLGGPGERYIRISAHQARDVTNMPDGILNLPDNPDGAFDYIQNTDTKYFIGDPNVPDVSQRMLNPLGVADGLTISTKAKDLALLRISEKMPDAAEPNTFDSLDKIVPLDYSLESDPNYKPVPGQKVALFGMPLSNKYIPMSATGTFIKRVKIINENNKGTRLVDYVGIKGNSKPSNPRANTCNIGSSGMHYTANVKGRIMVSGPESRTISLKYDPKNPSWTYSDGTPIPMAEKLKASKRYWAEIKNQTGVNIDPFDRICIFEVPGSEMRALTTNFGNYPKAGIGEPAKGGTP